MVRKNKAQAALEYAILLLIVAVALVTIRVYAVRAFQERYRQSADVFGQGEQYETGSKGKKTQVLQYR